MSFDTAERLNLAIAVGAILTSWMFASRYFTASLALGAVMEVVNYRALRRSTQLFFQGHLQGAGAWTGGLGMRFGLLAGAMTFAIWAGVHPVGLVIGLSTIVPAALIAAAISKPGPVSPDASTLSPDDPSWDAWNPWLAREHDPDEDDEDES